MARERLKPLTVSDYKENNMIEIKHLLGVEVEDKITGYKGVVTSVSLDVSGCEQALVVQKYDYNKNESYSKWIDPVRLNILERIVDSPNLSNLGPEDKPTK